MKTTIEALRELLSALDGTTRRFDRLPTSPEDMRAWERLAVAREEARNISLAAAVSESAIKTNYTDKDATALGGKIAEVFVMRRSRTEKDRWQTTWGNKTNLGLFRMFLRMAEEINSGKLSEGLKP